MATATAMPDVSAETQKLVDIRSEMRTSLVELDEETNLLMLCVLARIHPLLIGPPGVAKSMVVREFFKHIDGAQFFEVLMMKDTPTEQVLGPISLKGLENDTFTRIVTGKLPEANLAFLDEIWKSNSTVLNALLTILNERLFHNNGGILNVPLWSCVGASNELPGHDRDDLRAIRDRFGICKMVNGVQTEDGFKDILRGQIGRRQQIASNTSTTMIDTPEIEAMQEAVTLVTLPEDVLNDLAQLKRRAEQENLHVSARRFGEGVAGMQALAKLNGRDTVISDDIALFQHILWTDPEDAKVAYQLTLDYAGIVAKKASQYRTQFEPIKQEIAEIKAKIDPNDANAVTQEVAGGFAKAQMALKNLRGRVEKQISDASADKRDTRELDALFQEIEEQRGVVREVLGM